MTNNEAIILLRNLEDALDSYCELNKEGKTAFRMAIESLELFGISEYLPTAQPEPSEIARDIATILVNEMDMRVIAKNAVQPEKGKWLDNETSYADGVRQTCTCSACGLRSVRPLGNFCRWCGADMRGEQDE